MQWQASIFCSVDESSRALSERHANVGRAVFAPNPTFLTLLLSLRPTICIIQALSLPLKWIRGTQQLLRSSALIASECCLYCYSRPLFS